MTENTVDYSVVIPYYNAEPWINTALKSVQAQTAKPTRVVVVDDGSRIPLKLSTSNFDFEVRVVRTENRGLGASRNRGMAEIESNWITFLDADDLWSPERMERLIAAVEKHADGIAFSSSWTQFTHEASIHECDPNVIFTEASELNLLDDLIAKVPRYTRSSSFLPWIDDRPPRGPVVFSSALYRREILLSAGGFPTFMSTNEDCFAWRALVRFGTLYANTDPSYFYRRRFGSLVTSASVAADRLLRSAIQPTADSVPDRDLVSILRQLPMRSAIQDRSKFVGLAIAAGMPLRRLPRSLLASCVHRVNRPGSETTSIKSETP